MVFRIFSVVLTAFLTTSCAQINTTLLAQDALQGRDNLSAGSTAVQNYLIGQLSGGGASGLNSAGAGDAAFKQVFPTGTNIMALIPGTDMADEYVMVGAHYDHLAGCTVVSAGDTVCNGATDNAAGVAAVIDIGLHLSLVANRPRRSVILAFWDSEEDGLLGSEYYVDNPLIPLADTVAYINFDILGSNILPSLRNVSIAVGAESGGAPLIGGVQSAIGTETLDVKMFSEIFGQGRSDHANLIAAGVPSVFFTDSTGPCYHTTGDDISVVDFDKLNTQIRIAINLTEQLVSGALTPVFDGSAPPATYEDAVEFDALMQQALVDIGRFSPADQANLLAWVSTMAAIVSDGPAAFGADDLNNMLLIALQVVSLLASGECDGFLEG